MATRPVPRVIIGPLVRSIRRLALGVAVAAVALGAGATRTAAQVTGPAGGTGRPATVSEQAVRDAVRRSGLSEEQVRERLRAQGYDPALVDRYLGSTPGSADGPASPVPAAALDALRAAGVRVAPDATELRADSADGGDTASETVAPAVGLPGGTRAAADRVFGRDVFTRASTLFAPLTGAAVDPGYRLGGGDTLQVVLTGQVEAAYQVAVRRDGTIVLPRFGTVTVAGLTQDAARTLLRRRAVGLWSGVAQGRTRVDLAVTRTRTSLVYVIGEVEQPGAYSVSALGTAFHALARAGGPTDRGSFRAVEVRRAGRVVRRLDLYDYLVRGDITGDERLEQGDVVYVPIAGRTVRLEGAVRRPGIFQLAEGEGAADLLAFAGGVLPTAGAERVQVDRILPAAQRTPGRERVVLDLPGVRDPAALARVALYDGDALRVPAVGLLRRNVVVVRGAVVDSGTFALRPGMTLGQLLDAAQGPLPWAVTERVKLRRQQPATGGRELRSLDLADPAARATRLAEFDTVEVLDARAQQPSGTVYVTGAVTRGDRTLPFAAGMTLRDAVDLVGGFREDAQRIEVARRRVSASYSDTTSELLTFGVGRPTDPNPALARVALRPDDRVAVRASPGFRAQRFVELAGLFRTPGQYAINEGLDRVTDVLARAGGLLPAAQLASFRVVREGRTVAVRLDAALRERGRDNLLLQHGDRLSIEADPQTVLVTGEVQRSLLVAYDRRLTVRDYLERAGGLRESADVRRILVESPGGGVRRVRRSLGRLDLQGGIEPGSVISVPARPERPRLSLRETLTTVLQVTSALASLALAYVAIRRQ